MMRVRGMLMLTGVAMLCAVLSGCGDDDNNTPSGGVGTPTRTRTATLAPTATATPTPRTLGPVVTYFGITRADDTLIDSSGTANGIPVFLRQTGSGFRIVVEGQPGSSGSAVGDSSYDGNLTAFPDLQIETSRTLGNGSVAVCDSDSQTGGGVPATNPPNFDANSDHLAAVNDLACRFRDGQGNPRGLTEQDACVKLLPGEDYGFVSSGTTLQFCGFVTTLIEFQLGDTILTARLRDVAGHTGDPKQIVIRVMP